MRSRRLCLSMTTMTSKVISHRLASSPASLFWPSPALPDLATPSLGSRTLCSAAPALCLCGPSPRHGLLRASSWVNPTSSYPILLRRSWPCHSLVLRWGHGTELTAMLHFLAWLLVSPSFRCAPSQSSFSAKFPFFYPWFSSASPCSDAIWRLHRSYSCKHLCVGLIHPPLFILHSFGSCLMIALLFWHSIQQGHFCVCISTRPTRCPPVGPLSWRLAT